MKHEKDNTILGSSQRVKKDTENTDRCERMTSGVCWRACVVSTQGLYLPVPVQALEITMSYHPLYTPAWSQKPDR